MVQRTTQRIPFPRNLLFVISLMTNSRWMKSVYGPKNAEGSPQSAARASA
jgi:hypothetical protein